MEHQTLGQWDDCPIDPSTQRTNLYASWVKLRQQDLAKLRTFKGWIFSFKIYIKKKSFRDFFLSISGHAKSYQTSGGVFFGQDRKKNLQNLKKHIPSIFGQYKFKTSLCLKSNKVWKDDGWCICWIIGRARRFSQFIEKLTIYKSYAIFRNN